MTKILVFDNLCLYYLKILNKLIKEELLLTYRPFKADHVGSLLRPQKIKDARAKYNQNEISGAELKQIEDEEIDRIIEKQLEIGLHSITDGEFRRSWWHFDFLENLDGVEGYTPDHGLEFEGLETRAHNVRVVDKVRYNPNHPILTISSSYMTELMDALPQKYQFRVQTNYSTLTY